MEQVLISIATIFLKKALEKSGDKFGEALTARVGEAITQIGKYSPETAKALEAADPSVLNLGVAELEKIQPDPIFAELVAAADAEENQELRRKLEEYKQSKQVGLQDISAQELEAEIDQKAAANPKGVEQIGATGVKVEGKAKFKVNQSIE